MVNIRARAIFYQLKMENTTFHKYIENKSSLTVIQLKHHIYSQICLFS